MSEIWPGARLACYGSRATGLAAPRRTWTWWCLACQASRGHPTCRRAACAGRPGSSACRASPRRVQTAAPIVTLTAAMAAGAEDLHLDISLPRRSTGHRRAARAPAPGAARTAATATDPQAAATPPAAQGYLHGRVLSYALTVMTARAARGRARGGTQGPALFSLAMGSLQPKGGVGEGKQHHATTETRARTQRGRGREDSERANAGGRGEREQQAACPFPACSEAASPGLAKCTVSRPR